MDSVPPWETITVGICLLLSGFFSASETALTSISEVKAKHLIEQRPRIAAGLKLWVARPTRVLTAILIGNNLVNIAASALATDIAARLFPDSGVPVAIGVMTFLVLVFGEVIPKSVVRARPEGYAMVATQVLRIFYYAIFPITYFFWAITRGTVKLAGGSLDRQGPSVTEAEIEHMVRIGQEEGEIEKDEKELIHAVFEFGDTLVKEIMVPRTSMVAVDVGITLEGAARTVAECGHSRIPVYRTRIDNIVGILYAKDLLRNEEGNGAQFQIASLLRPTFFVPATKKINELLKEFQKRRVHLAIVVDEYGGTSGIITIEDIIEQIVGDIRDEYDDEEPLLNKLDDLRFEADAQIDLDDLGEAIGAEFPDEQAYETLGGFVTDQCGCVPSAGQQFRWRHFNFRVLRSAPTRVERVLIEVLPKLVKSEDSPVEAEPA